MSYSSNIISENPPTCMNYCDMASPSMTASRRLWCNEQKKLYCTQEYNQLREKGDSVALTEFVNRKDCGCHLPDTVYDEYIEDLIEKMGPSANSFIQQYLRDNKKCMFPSCSAALSHQRHTSECTIPNICVQNTDVKIDAGSISGNIDTTVAQNCVANIQNVEKANCVYNNWTNWSACKDGERSRQRTLKSGDASVCPTETEYEDCEETPVTPTEEEETPVTPTEEEETPVTPTEETEEEETEEEEESNFLLREVRGLKVWMWIVIGLVSLLLLILVIVVFF